jgi:uncharacterized radical SAM superfamily protein
VVFLKTDLRQKPNRGLDKQDSCSLTPLETLKIDLLCHGMSIPTSTYKALSKDSKPLTLQEYATTSGVGLKLSHEIYVNAPVFENFCRKAKHSLIFDGVNYHLVGPLGDFQVEPIPVPSYYNKRNKDGVLYTFFTVTHTDRARTSPIAGCSYRCKFCDLPLQYRYIKKNPNDLIESIEVALSDEVLPAKHLLISGGTPSPRDYEYMDNVYKSVLSKIDVPVEIMMVPRPDLNHIEKLYSWGVYMLYFNLELYGEQISRKLMPSKYSVSQKHYLSAIETAVQVFGWGRVKSLIIVGLERMEDTLKAVRVLAERGCVPVLSPFRPSPITPLANYPAPNFDLLINVFKRSREIADEFGVKLGPECIPCQHNTLTFPDDSGFYKFF